MSSNLFKIIQHTIPCQHIRDYPQATAYEQEDVLHLAVKQYVPLDNPTPQPGDITIVGAHACGFPKELYEPLWEDVLTRAKSRNIRIRSIWIADLAQQGQSGVLNEELLGNEPSWNDHARDLLHLINLKREQMPRPIVGMGHSMGGTQLVNLAYMHPRLFTTLVLIDPAMGTLSSTPPEAGPNPGMLSTFRKISGLHGTQPQRNLELADSIRDGILGYLSVGLNGKKPVTLTTTKHQEVFTFVRPNFDGYGPDKAPNRRTHADLNPNLPTIYPFYRPDSPSTFFRLPELRPSVLYIFGRQSSISAAPAWQAKMETTGIGVGGSGGAKAGCVKSVWLEDVGHLIPMEAVDQTADAALDWLDSEMQRWRKEEDEFRKMWSAKPIQEKRMIDDKWKQMMGPLPGKKPVAPKM